MEEKTQTVPLAVDVKNAIASLPPGSSERDRQDAVTAVVKRRKVTLTEALIHPDRNVQMRVRRALLGMHLDDDKWIEVQDAKPALEFVRLQSLCKRCPQCAKNACKREGKFHNIVYSAGKVVADAGKLREHANLHGTIHDLVECEVDPATGLFQDPVTTQEAIKILRQFGEHIRKPRFMDRTHRTGDRWLVRDVTHADRFNPSNEATTTTGPTATTAVL